MEEEDIQILQQSMVIPRSPMTCGQADAQEPFYRMIRGDSGNWFVPVRLWDGSFKRGCADGIQYDDLGDSTSDGYGGATLIFNVRGFSGCVTKYIAKGPWHSNSKSLKDDTGIDITKRHLTQVFISLDKVYPENSWEPDVLFDLIHIEKEPIEGAYNRADPLAQEYADALDEPVYLVVKTSGGESRVTVFPSEGWDRETKRYKNWCNRNSYNQREASSENAASNVREPIEINWDDMRLFEKVLTTYFGDSILNYSVADALPELTQINYNLIMKNK